METKDVFFEQYNDCVNCYFFASGFCTLKAQESTGEECENYENVFEH